MLDSLNNIENDSILCTIDVVGLYPNIPNNAALDAIRDALETRKDKNMELAECVIKTNLFEHDNTYFKQKQGTAPHMPYYLWKNLKNKI